LKVADKIFKTLDELNINYEKFYTEYPGHAKLLSKESVNLGVHCVLAVGGDGTVFEVAQGLIGSQTSLGIIPAGTGNDFIKSLELPNNPIKCLKTILDSTPKKIDIGKINDEIFMNVCGVGFDVSVLEYSLKAKKYFKGMLPYLWGVIRTIISYTPTCIKLTVDGEIKLEENVLVCCVANGIYIGGGMPISPESNIKDGLLDVVLIKNVNRLKMIKYLPGLLGGKILEFEDTVSFKGKSIKFESNEIMKINIDGEIKELAEAEFILMHGIISICY